MPTSQPKPGTNPSDTSFEQRTRAVMTQMRNGLSRLLAELPNGAPRAVDVQRTLGFNQNTSWRLHKVATVTADPLTVGIYLPGRTTFQRLRQESERLGVSISTLDAVTNAHDAFESLVATYAGDRATFDMMISAFAGSDAEQIDLQGRRTAFRGISQVFGVQARLLTATSVYFKNAEDDSRLDMVSLQGLCDFKRLRPGISWSLARVMAFSGTGTPGMSRPGPLFEDTFENTGLLDRFSSPTNDIHLVRPDDHTALVQIAGDDVGLPSAQTFLFANTMRAYGHARRTATGNSVHSLASIRTPVEALHRVIMVDDETFGSVMPTTHVYNDLFRDLSVNAPEQCKPHMLPCHEQLVPMGRGFDALHTPDFPQYVEVLEHIFAHAGLDPTRFHAFHVKVEYPVMSSSLCASFPLSD